MNVHCMQVSGLLNRVGTTVAPPRGATVLMIALVLLLVSQSHDAHARGRGRSGARQAAAARKQQMIKVLQNQLVVARQILVAAESKQSMSSHEVSQAINQLSELRTSIDEAQVNAREAAKSLHEIESEILDQQPPESDFAKDQARLEEAKVQVHATIHQTISLPDDSDKPADLARLGDLAKLTSEDRQRLEGNENYLRAKRDLIEATRRLSQAKKSLLEQDSDWIAARDELREAEQKASQGKQQATTIGVGSLDARQDLRKSQTVATTARGLVAQLEYRLRQLGVKDVTPVATTTRR